MKNGSCHLKLWETALLALLCVALCVAVWAQGVSALIDDAVIRLHVLAVDDSAEEQALKLRVRDAVLDCLAERLSETDGKEEAKRVLASSLGEIEQTARRVSEGRAVSVTLTRESYPTRRYGGFSLPAGRYDSLRVILGPGEGHNWWCVVFPPLCLAAESTEPMEEALGEARFQILCADGETALRFRLLELWGELTERF